MKEELKTALLTIFASVVFSCAPCFAQSAQTAPFSGTINGDNINIRADSNTNSKIISTVSKGEIVEIVLEKYDWYKIKLPKTASVFVKKDLLFPIDEKTAKASKDNINIRMAPNESSAILGRIHKNEVIAILEDKGGWYRIAPSDNSFGWIHKKFVDKAAGPAAKIEAPQAKPEAPAALKITVEAQSAPKDENISIEGIIQPYGRVIKRVATHKLITKDYEIFLLKGNVNNLNAFTYHKVRISGKPVPSPKDKYPVIEIIKMEALD